MAARDRHEIEHDPGERLRDLPLPEAVHDGEPFAGAEHHDPISEREALVIFLQIREPERLGNALSVHPLRADRRCLPSDCTKCGGAAFYTRRYSGEIALPACFCDLDRREDEEDHLEVRDAPARRQGRSGGLWRERQPFSAPGAAIAVCRQRLRTRRPHGRRGRGGVQGRIDRTCGVARRRSSSMEHVARLLQGTLRLRPRRGAGLEGREGRLVLQHVRRVPEEGNRRGRPAGRA